MKKFFIIIFFLITCVIITACTHQISDNDSETTPTDTTLTQTTPADSEIRTAKYDFEISLPFYPVLKQDKDGKQYVNLDFKVTCVSGRDYYMSSHGFSPARAWLILPDGTKISAANPVSDAVTQIDINEGDVFGENLHFYELPDSFEPGKYSFLISEYDDVTGDGDYDKELFEDITVGSMTAKYEFELHGDVILKSFSGSDSLSASIPCTVTCVDGCDFYMSANSPVFAYAWLIMPDGTKYSELRLVNHAHTQVYVLPGVEIQESFSFGKLPHDFVPGKYDIFVSTSPDFDNRIVSHKLFENVTVRFETE